MTSSDWSNESLYTKAQLYMERALQSDRGRSLFPFWSSLSLELLGRAALSKIHPALIADPREGHNILHAFGYSPKKGVPKTIGAKTIFLRLQLIMPEFTEENEKFCQSFINMRNEELHTGTAIFEDFSTNIWLIDFYKAIKILLEFQGKSLEEFLGKQEAGIALEMISEENKELESKVKQKISKFRDVFNELEEAEKADRIEKAKKKNWEYIRSEKLNNKYKTVECPSCGNESLIIGKYISQSEPKVVEDAIEVHHNILPVGLRCFCCGLKFEKNGELTVANLGGQFTVEDHVEPAEYYGITFDPIEELKREGYTLNDLANHFDPEYGFSFEPNFDDYGND
jgi:hypothetical protein